MFAIQTSISPGKCSNGLCLEMGQLCSISCTARCMEGGSLFYVVSLTTLSDERIGESCSASVTSCYPWLASAPPLKAEYYAEFYTHWQVDKVKTTSNLRQKN